MIEVNCGELRPDSAFGIDFPRREANLAIRATRRLEPIQTRGLVRAWFAFPVRPEPFSGHQIFETVTIDISRNQCVRL